MVEGYESGDCLLCSFTVGCLEIPCLVAQIANNILFFPDRFFNFPLGTVVE
jgi:hypothetical protein